jgi:hypothetical protein
VSLYHHKPIRKFDLDGQIFDEASTPRLKVEYIRLIVSQMKFLGYCPRLDIEPDFTIYYNEEKEIFSFKLSVYGTYVGKRKSEWIIGLDGATPIYTQRSKSNESLQEQVLP